VSDIDRIRAEVEGLQEQHVPDSWNNCLGCAFVWPCPALRLAEKVLKLAEAVEYFRDAMPFKSCGQRMAERALAECAKEGP